MSNISDTLRTLEEAARKVSRGHINADPDWDKLSTISQAILNLRQAEYIRSCTEAMDNEAKLEDSQGDPGDDTDRE